LRLKILNIYNVEYIFDERWKGLMQKQLLG
jgi:hypothetical protein